LPYLMRKKTQVTQMAKAKYHLRKASKAAKTDSASSSPSTAAANLSNSTQVSQALKDDALWKIYLANSLAVPTYNPFSDFAEMATQFGYLSLFSIIWPVAPLAGFINNMIEIKSDLWKLCNHCRRPIPRRTEDIGPWLKFLQLFSWASTITNMSLVVLFFNWSFIPTPAWVDLIFIIIFEHLYFLIRHILKNSIVGVPEEIKEKMQQEEFEHRNYITKELGLKND